MAPIAILDDLCQLAVAISEMARDSRTVNLDWG